jgi:hypothetical protein
MTGPIPYCFTRYGAVGAKIVDYVTELTLRNQDFFQINMASPGRKFFIIENVTADGDTVLFELKQSLAEYYGLGDYVVPPNLKDFIGYITDGGAIHPHRDPDLPGRRHVRINVLISQPAGCTPLIDGIPIAVAVGDAWLNLASRCVHALQLRVMDIAARSVLDIRSTRGEVMSCMKYWCFPATPYGPVSRRQLTRLKTSFRNSSVTQVRP